jgi:rhodanese-related sulfurtransferase
MDLSRVQDVYDHISEVQLVDVREDYEWVAGRIDGAVHLQLNLLMNGAGEFDKGRPVVAVCRSGNRSELATLMLRARGYEAYNLEGGVEEWDRQHLPLITSDGSPGRVA